MFQNSHKTNFLTFILPLFLFNHAFSQYHYTSYYCDQTIGNYTKPSPYQNNLKDLHSKLTSKASNSSFGNDTVGEKSPDIAYGLYLCRGDLEKPQCHDCVKAAILTINDVCKEQKTAMVWYQECMVRYSNSTIFSFEDESLVSYLCSARAVSDPEVFGTKFGETVNESIMQAAYPENGTGYAVNETAISSYETVYVLAQCTRDILGSQCERCLRVALSTMAGACGTDRMSVAVYLPSCWLRYDQAPFLMNRNAPPFAPPQNAMSPPPGSNSFRTTSIGTFTRTTLWIGFTLWLLKAVNT